MTQVTKKDYSKLSDVVFQIETKHAELIQNEVKQLTQIGPCEEQVKLFKALAQEAKTTREPITKKLDEVKARLMEAEKVLSIRAIESESLLKKARQIEWDKAQEAKRKADEEAKKHLEKQKSRLQFINDCTEIFDKNVEWFLANPNKMSLADFVEKLKNRLKKEEIDKGYEYDINLVDRWAREYEFGHKNSAPVVEIQTKIKQDEHKAILEATKISTTVQTDVKPPKKIYELELTDETILKDVLITWAGNFRFINDKLRVKDLANIKISSVIDIICKHREEIDTNLVFTVKEEFK